MVMVGPSLRWLGAAMHPFPWSQNRSGAECNQLNSKQYHCFRNGAVQVKHNMLQGIPPDRWMAFGMSGPHIEPLQIA